MSTRSHVQPCAGGWGGLDRGRSTECAADSAPLVVRMQADAGQAGGAHQPRHPLAPAHARPQAELGVQPRCAVGTAAYRHRLGQQIFPGVGDLRVRELSVGTIERHLRRIADEHGPAMAKMTQEHPERRLRRGRS